MNGSAAATSGKTWDEASSPEATRVSRHYEDSWRRSGRARPDLNGYLSKLDGLDGNSGVRLALFRTDMSLRWEIGEKVGAGWYLERFGDISEDALVALVYEEFCLREEEGEQPIAADFQARFPQISRGLQRVFEIHGLVGSGGVSVSSLSSGGGNPSSDIPFPEVGQTIAGFHLVEELGKGAFARVFLAHERQLADRPVALKVTRKGSREPQTLARLQHTHIVPVYSHRVDPATGLNLLCMPYFGRITLAQILSDTKSSMSHHVGNLAESLDRLAPTESPDSNRSEGRLALASRTFARAIAWWGARLAEALQHAHERGVLHRDIKPSNVLVTADGMPMLLDFNLAREPLVDGKEEANAGNLGGTIDYMAPEHLEALADCSPHQVDGRSDIFGLGVVLYEAVMGHRPFQQIRKRSSMSEALLSAADERREGPPRLRITRPEISPALETVIRRCLEPVPADRYQTGADLAADLQAVADDRPLLFAREPLLNRFATWTRHRRRRLVTLASIMATLMFILVALGTVLVQRRIDYLEQCTRVRGLIKSAQEAFDGGNFAQAKQLFRTAFQLSEAPDWRKSSTPDDSREPGRLRTLFKDALLGFDGGHILADLQLMAHTKETYAATMAERCDEADAFHRASDGLRFRLIGLDNDLTSASQELQKALKPFRVLAPADVEDWTQRDGLKDRLDPGRMARLKHEVNELLFIWVSEIDITLMRSRVPDTESAARALNICDRALCFVDRPGPWKALRARLERHSGYGSAGNGQRTSPPGEKVTGREVRIASFAPRDVRDEPSALAAFQWGMLSINEPNLDAALPWLERAVELEAKNYWYQYYLAYAHQKRGQFSKATDHFNKAMDHYNVAADLHPGSPWVHLSRARLYHNAVGNWRKAVEDLNLALREFGDRPGARHVELELGIVYQSLGDDRKARDYFRSVIRKNPNDDYGRAAQLNLANGQFELGGIAEAMSAYEELLTLNPMDQAARRNRALALLRTGDAPGSEADLTFLVDLGERCQAREQILATRALARLIQDKSKAEGALSDATMARDIKPTRANERLRQRALLASGRFGELRLDRPEEVILLPPGGRSLEADLRAAVVGLNQRMRRGSAQVYPASSTQAVLLAALNEHSAAETAANLALQVSPDSPHALLIRARARFFADNLQGAIADVTRGLAMWPSDPGLQEMRAALLTRVGRPAEALKELKLINSEGISHPAIDTWRARAQMALGDFQLASISWSLAIGKDPELAEAYLGRAQCLIVRKQWTEAVIDLAKAATWANSDVGLETQVFLGFTRCLAERPSLAGRWLSMGWRLAIHAWEQRRTSVLSR